MWVDGHTHEHFHGFSIALSLALGALHALEPGHGKTALAAHLLTEKKDFRKPLLLALSTAISHALSITFIAFLTHGLLHAFLPMHFSPQEVTSALKIVSGIVLLAVGSFLLLKAVKGQETGSSHNCSHCSSTENAHSKAQGKTKSYRTIAIGFAVGLIPCPTALAALSTVVTSADWFSATVVVSTFSLGIFLSLLGVGLLLGFKGKKLLSKLSFLESNPMMGRYLQSSILIIVGAGHIIFSML